MFDIYHLPGCPPRSGRNTTPPTVKNISGSIERKEPWNMQLLASMREGFTSTTGDI
jgi:hypothetical protein